MYYLLLFATYPTKKYIENNQTPKQIDLTQESCERIHAQQSRTLHTAPTSKPDAIAWFIY